MGFLDFLGGKKKQESIGFSELPEWLDKQVESKRLDQRIARAKESIGSIIDQGRKHLEDLEKASLMNENISIREKQIMEGHRKVYVQRIKKFYDNLAVPSDFSEVGHYAARISEQLDALSQETKKNFMVLKQYLDVELTKVAKSVKATEDELSKLQQEIDREGIELIREAKIRLKQYHNDLARKENLELEKAKEEDDLDILRKKRDKLETRLEDLKKSREYGEFKIFIEDKKKYEEMINGIDQELIAIFAELNRPLKKFTHNNLHEKLIDKYIADPAGALEEDESITIHEVLRKMDQEIDSLELRDKQLEKTIEMLAKLNQEYLTEKRNEIARIKTLNNEAAGRLNKSVVALNLSEHESWLKSIDNKIAETERAIDHINKEIEELNPDYLRQRVKEKIKEIASHVNIEDDS